MEGHLQLASVHGDDDGGELFEGEFRVEEQFAIRPKITVAWSCRASGVGVPFSDPDAPVVVVGLVGESAGVVQVPQESNGGPPSGSFRASS